MEDVLFVAQTAGASCYHRIMLPALALGCDWVGLDAPPPHVVVGRGEVRSKDGEPDFGAYRIVVVQMPGQEDWADVIAELQRGGTTVLYEVDYDIHALEEDPGILATVEKLMAMCDGVICATDRLAERYAMFNSRTFVCENGIDLRAYSLTRPAHGTVNIGWSGTTLTIEEVQPWLNAISDVMRARDVTNFISIGARFGDALAGSGAVAPERCLALPPMLPEQVPAAMSIFDIVFDPAGRSPWRLGRSQLRWLEAGAWGMPMIGDRRIYAHIADGITGFHASDPVSTARAVLRLVDDPELRARVGARARREIEQRWSMEAVAPQWERAFAQAVA